MSKDKSWEISDTDGLRLLDILAGTMRYPIAPTPALPPPAEDLADALEILGYWQHEPTRERRRALLEDVLTRSVSARMRYCAGSGLAYIRDQKSLDCVRQAAEKETIDEVKVSLLHLIEYLESAPEITDTPASATARHKANLTFRLSDLQPAMAEAEALRMQIAEINLEENTQKRRLLIGTYWKHLAAPDEWAYFQIRGISGWAGSYIGLCFVAGSTFKIMPDDALPNPDRAEQISEGEFNGQFSSMLLAISTLVELPRTFEQRVAGACLLIAMKKRELESVPLFHPRRDELDAEIRKLEAMIERDVAGEIEKRGVPNA